VGAEAIARRDAASAPLREVSGACQAIHLPALLSCAESCGNVLSAIVFLAGPASEELSRAELEETDPYLPLLITIRAQKSGLI
jgi:hypothetical protein